MMKAGMIIVLAALIILALAAAFYVGMSASDMNANKSGSSANTVDFIGPGGRVMATVYVEIADTPQEREQGLMYRTSMGEDKGMLFIFDGDYPQSFWMKNTPLPLDMVFIDSRYGIVDINYNATPYSESVFTSRGSSKYVVEVNGGFCKRYGIGIGDRIKIYVRPTAH